MLSSQFKYQFKAPVWRLRFDPAGQGLAIEVRDGDVLLAHFYTFNSLDYTLKQVKLPPEKNWWQGLEDIHDGIFFVHGYGDRKLGQHKGIKAYRAKDHELKWELTDYSFYGVAENGIVAFATANPEDNFIVIDTTSGKTVREGLKQQEASEIVQNYAAKRYESCTFPIRYLAGEAYYEEVSGFIKHTLAEETVQAVEYAEINNFIVISYYLQGIDNKLNNYLAVFNTDGELLLKDCLGEGLSGLGSDTFIIFNQNLYFVQHKDILRVYKLF